MPLSSQKLISFLATANSSVSRNFYCERLGFTLIYEDDFALVLDAFGTELRIQKLREVSAQPFTVLGWSVKSIRDVVISLTDAGVIFEQFEGMRQDSLSVWQSPSGAQIAWFKDPDENILSLTQQASSGI